MKKITIQEISTVFSLLELDHPKTMLEQFSHYSAFKMLVMTMLSARAKDSTTIPIVVEMYKKYSTPKDFVKIDLKKLEKMIYKIGFFRAKAKNVKGLSKIILEQYGGKVPDNLDELISLPGVGRKTANCLLSYKFNQPAIAVDIHVHRISNRLGWVKTVSPEKTEMALQKLVPKKEWINVNRLLVGHGQTICAPRKPKCGVCRIRPYCKFGRALIS